MEAGARTVVEATVSPAFEPRLRFDDGTRLDALHTSSDPGHELWWFGQGGFSILVWPDRAGDPSDWI